jgi:predicted small secreted protein
MKMIFSLAAAIALFGVAACNTVEGAGRDVESAGEAVQDAAE